MKEEFCKKRNCPFLGKMNEGDYGLRETPYCEFAPETIWGDRRIKRMKQCPNAESKEKMKERKVTITCTEKQLAMLEMVCDRYSRLIQGQLDNSLQEVCEEAWEKRNKTKEYIHGVGSPEWYDMRHNLEERLKEMEKDYWGLSGGRYNGIGYDDYADILWDMHQVMRHARYLAMPKEAQERMRVTVMAYKAMRVGTEPLIEVKYEED